MTPAKISLSLLLAALFSASLPVAALELGGRKDASSSACAESSDSCSAVPAGKKGALDIKLLPQLPVSAASSSAAAPASTEIVKKSSFTSAVASPAAAPAPQPAAPVPAPAANASCAMPAWLKICAAVAVAVVAFMAWKIFSGGKK